jgi:mono/diheme cytochrome c family protein
MKRWRAIVAVALVSVGGLGCASPRRGEPLVGPLPVDSPQVARGREVFMAHCYACHPGGEAGLAPAINDKPLPGFMIKTQVRAGVGAMPRFSSDEIPAQDLDALVIYLKALRRHG